MPPSIRGCCDIHLLVHLPPTVALSRQEFPDLARHSWRAKRLWAGAYVAGSVGGVPLHVPGPTSPSSADRTTRHTSAMQAGALSWKISSATTHPRPGAQAR